MQPNVYITELDNQLGVVPTTANRLLAVVGCATKGAVNLPASFSTIADVVSTYESGALVESGALAISRGCAIVAVRAAAAASDFGSITEQYNVVKDAASTSSIVVEAPDATTQPRDFYQLVFKITTGGTLGTAGIQYQYSLNGGTDWSAISALGTDMEILLDAGIALTFVAGTVTAGDTFTVDTEPPNFDSTTLTAALTGLAKSAANFEIVAIAGVLDPTTAAAVEAAVGAMRNVDKRHSWIGHVRQQMLVTPGVEPGPAETAAEYIASISTAFTNFITKQGGLSAGDGYVISAVTGLEQRRPLSWLYAPITQAVSEEIDVADTNLGALPFRITDVNGNPQAGCYNETMNPGLSDAGFVTARTFNGGLAGVYVNLPLLKNAAGSDFDIHPMRRVMDLAADAAYLFFVRRLNQPVQVDKLTGKLKESARKAMEAAAQTTLAGVLLAKPKASDVTVVISHADNVLSTKTIHVSIAIVPLGYITTIRITMAFRNPALTVQAA